MYPGRQGHGKAMKSKSKSKCSGNLSLQLLNYVRFQTKFLSFIGASSACHAPLADASGSVAAPGKQHLCFGISRRPPLAPRPSSGAPRPWPPQSPGITLCCNGLMRLSRLSPHQPAQLLVKQRTRYADGICTAACSMRF